MSEWGIPAGHVPTGPPPGPPSIFFEDLNVGPVGRWGPYVVTRDEIIGFARQYDPQRIHLDVGPRELIAAGWHTCAMTMRLVVDGWLGQVASIASPGVDEIRATVPVRPGDELWASADVLDLRRSRSRPDRGIVRYQMITTNQTGAAVVRIVTTLLVDCRSSE